MGLIATYVYCIECRRTVPLYRESIIYTIKSWNEAARSANISYWLDDGTLLGAIRNHGRVLPLDHDGDVGFLYEDRMKVESLALMLDDLYDVKMEYHDRHHNGYRGYQLSYYGAYLDVLAYYIDPRDSTLYRRKGGYPNRFPRNILKPLKEIEFEDSTCFVPNQPEEYLRHRYGPNWKTPIEFSVWKKVFGVSSVPTGICLMLNIVFLILTPCVGGIWILWKRRQTTLRFHEG
eukprot:TRINITY_DN82838_c0_g1_i1.p1 TRINITY_DN82838_c0_g1~~TRINITY_DN82838_c0_g1_i1.p1  ORF type:complete len:274 (+),score=24.45 TRINITY_DN82838_c0_g1_i1:125-823(+)